VRFARAWAASAVCRHPRSAGINKGEADYAETARMTRMGAADGALVLGQRA
jgi:hypothetical protein